MRISGMSVLIAVTLAVTLAQSSQAQDLWVAKCRWCHGVDGRADGRMGHRYQVPDLTTAAFQRSRTDAMLVENILRGVEGTRMRAFVDRLAVSDVQDLVALIRSFGREHARENLNRPSDAAEIVAVSAAITARDSEAEALLNVARNAYKIGERAKALQALHAAQALGWNDLDLVNALGSQLPQPTAPTQWPAAQRISHADDVSDL